MKKEAQVVMLPTDKASNILRNKIKTDEGYGYVLTYVKSQTVCENDGLLSGNQHLYITDDSEIKEGDWVYWIDPEGLTSDINKVISVNEDMIFMSHPEHSETEALPHECKKIIATTDPELTGIKKEWEEFSGDWHKSSKLGLPKIPQSFIESYCKNPVDKVMVEYETMGEWDAKISNDLEGWECKTCYDWIFKNNPKCSCEVKLKLTSNNEIIIHPIEDKMYSETELIQFVLDNRFRIDSDTTRQEITNWINK